MTLRLTSLAALVLAAVAGPVRGDDIVLHTSARAAVDGIIRLADIARIDGDAAASFADLVVLETAPGAGAVIGIDDVRRRLDEAGVHWGRVNLSGRAVQIEAGTAPAATAPRAMQAMQLDGRADAVRTDDPVDDVPAVEIIGSPTLEGEIARRVVKALSAQPDDVRLGFVPADRDRRETSNATHAFEIEPQSSYASEQVTVLVRAWAGGRTAWTEKITFRPLLRVSMAVLAREIERGDAINAGDYEVRTDWMTPPQAGLLAAPDTLLGRIASRNLTRGEQIQQKEVRRATLVERGDRVHVRCLVGGIVISMQAVARDDGARGDVIALRKIGEREEFVATVTDRGEAVVDLGR